MPDALADLLIRHRHARAIALATLAGCAAALALALARLLTVFLDNAAPDVPPAAPMTVEQLVRGAEAGAASIASWHLFGNALPASDPRAVAAAPDTGLDLVLKGVFAGDEPASGRALIADGEGHEGHYQVGDEVAAGVRLDGVYPDRITLSRNGVIEALRLPRPEGAASGEGGAPAPGSLAAAIVPEQRTPLPGTPTAPAPFVQPMVSTGAFDWTAETAKLGVDAQQLAREVSVLPVLEGGRFVGVRLQGGRDSPLVARLGLEPNDVVTAVNGIELDSPARAAEVARSLSQARAATVTVRRDGKSQQLSVNLQ